MVSVGAPSSVLWSGACRSSFVRSLVLDLYPYVGSDLDGMFPLFYKQVTRKLSPKLAVIFRHLVKRSRFPAYLRLADVVTVPKESPPSDIGDYRPLSITQLLSKIF